MELLLCALLVIDTASVTVNPNNFLGGKSPILWMKKLRVGKV